MILFIKHIDIEGPDTLAVFFEEHGLQAKTLELQDGDSFPVNLSGIDAVVSLGGPMSVYEEEKYPFLKDENAFLKKVVVREIPFLGICLGLQLLAKACEAKIGKSPGKEIGFFPVTLTEEGRKDPLFEGLAERIDVFHWHEDMSKIPFGASLLASSDGCPHQAFKVGSCAYGLQFHIEVTEPTIRKWTEAYFPPGDAFREQQKRMILEDYQQKKEPFHQIADTVYNNFLKIIRSRK